MEETTLTEFKIAEKLSHAELLFSEDKKILLIVATVAYIPIGDFKEIFFKATDLIEKYNLTKVVFDKRKLTVFHQPSMEWYFTTWKEELLTKFGLKTHRKILPDNDVFIQSVKLGRMKIEKDFPNGRYKEMDIQYAHSIDEAVEL
jgi:hypothetical protein